MFYIVKIGIRFFLNLQFVCDEARTVCSGSDLVTDHPYCHFTPQSIRPFPVAEPRVQKPGGRKRGKSSILTDTPVKNALAEAAQHTKKKRDDSSARKKLLKEGSMRTTGNKGKKTAPKKSAPKKQTPKTREWSSAACAGNEKTICLVCGESFEEDWVQCLECHKWAHANCTDGNDYYVCHNCDDSD